MNLYHVRILLFFSFFIKLTGAYSQNCVSSINNTVINFSCGINCGALNLQIPDLRTTSTYSVSAIPYLPFTYTSPPGNELTSIYVDDVYSPVVNMGFNFCFYDSVYNTCVVGSNGLITFDLANANCGNSWQQTQQIPYAGGSICSAGSAYYPKASIMGIFTDLYPIATAGPPDRKIETRVEGSAPCRKFIVSYYHVGMFGNGVYSPGGSNCNSQNPSTFQIVLHESTGLIDVFIEKKQCSATSNPGGGNAIMGVQNWQRNAAVAAPGKNATTWNATNEGYRFTPAGGVSRFLSSQLFTLGGTLVATATTSNPTSGTINLSFPNICPTGSSEQFIVRSLYSSCIDPLTTLTFDDTITINKTSTLGATTSVTNINCATGATGSITVNVPAGSGVAPYQYSLNGGALQNSNVFSGLSPGFYTVYATDVNGCNSTLNATITRTGNLGVGFSVTNASCSGVNNGTITILPPSFYTPIQYSLNGGAPQTSNIFNNLAAGIYTVSVTDAVGCTGSTTINVTQGSGVTASFATTPTSCSGVNNGTITVTPGGVNFPYVYSINGGTYQNSNVFSSLAASTYIINVKDVNGCNANFNITVNPGSALVANVFKTNVLCNGAANGTITVNVSTGAPPYQYSLDNINWQTNNVFSGLAANTYTVYYRDNNACSNSQSVTITEPATLTVNISSQPTRCYGYNDGILSIAASGGVAPYTYSLDGVSYQGSNVFSLPAGIYTVYIKDVNGCVKTQSATITQPTALTATTITADATCNGGADGQITVNAIGGVSPYGYSSTGPVQSSNIFNVVPGIYNITVVDANACVTLVPNVVVGLNNNLSITPTPDKTICEGSSVQLNVNTNATQFSWTPASSLNNGNIRNPVASPTVTTEYVVTATYGQCSGKDTIVVNVNPAPIPDAGPDGDICFGQDYRLQGSGGAQFTWSPSTSLSSTTISNPLSTPQQTISYNLSVIDANGCPSLMQDQVMVKVTPPIIVKTFPSDTVVFAGDKFQLSATSAATDYSWSPPVGLSDPFVQNPILTVTTDISFNVIATTSAGCRGEATVSIKVFKGPEIYMPTGFTPNGDGRNDRFKPFTVGIVNINYFRVYNRWGQLIFSTNKLNEGWDGKVNGVDQPMGTFVWMVQGATADGKLITKKGTVTLIR